MKHQPLYVLLICLAGLAFSCMGESNQQTLYQRLGVAQAAPATLRTIDGFLITSPLFEGAKEGDCFRVNFKATLPEMPQGEVYDVSVHEIDTLPVWPFAKAFTDTLEFLKGEIRLKSVKVNHQNNYLDGRLFVYTVRDSFYLHEKANYELSYNWDETKTRDSNGNYIYDLFLRLSQTDGTDTIRTPNQTYANAFVIDEFLQRAADKEKGAGKDSVIMRMNYANRFNRDSTSWTWTATDTFAIRVSGF